MKSKEDIEKRLAEVEFDYVETARLLGICSNCEDQIMQEIARSHLKKVKHLEREIKTLISDLEKANKNIETPVEIKLLNFIQESGLADFEVTRGREDYFTCHASVCLDDFVIGEQVINPLVWFDLEEARANKPNWFKRNELFLLNNVFEENFKKFL